VQNLFFAYSFVLRAVMKAAPVLTSYQYDTGLPEEDQQTQQLIAQLVRTTQVWGFHVLPRTHTCTVLLDAFCPHAT
jgi:hypothetical protein